MVAYCFRLVGLGDLCWLLLFILFLLVGVFCLDGVCVLFSCWLAGWCFSGGFVGVWLICVCLFVAAGLCAIAVMNRVVLVSGC